MEVKFWLFYVLWWIMFCFVIGSFFMVCLIIFLCLLSSVLVCGVVCWLGMFGWIVELKRLICFFVFFCCWDKILCWVFVMLFLRICFIYVWNLVFVVLLKLVRFCWVFSIDCWMMLDGVIWICREGLRFWFVINNK